MATQWYYAIDGQRFGPVTGPQLRELATTGRLSPNDLVWKEGMMQWVQAESLQGLFPATAAAGDAIPIPPSEPSSVLDRVATKKKSKKSKGRRPHITPDVDRPSAAARPAPLATETTPREPKRRTTVRSQSHDFTPLAVIDLALKRYWTPWILRFTWALALACLILVFIDRSQISLRRLVDPQSQPQSVFIEPLMNLFAPQPSMPGEEPSSPRVQELKSYTAFLILFVLVLLWIRVVIESMIVIFNGVMHARSIDQQLRDMPLVRAERNE